MTVRASQLPQGWRWAKLGEVCRQDRRPISARDPAADRLRYLALEHIEPHSGRIIGGPGDSQALSATFTFDSIHVLYGKLRPYLNKVALPDFPGRCTTELIPLRPAPELDRHYLAWLLRRPETVRDAMRGKTGSRMPRANMNRLMGMLITLPPLAEQKRIAALLTEQLAAVDRARGAAEAQLQAAQALPAAFLREVFDSPEARAWPRTILGQAAEFMDSRRIPVNETERNRRIAGKPISDLFPYYGANGQVGWIDGFLFDEPAILLAEDGGAFGSRDRPIAYAVEGRYWVNNHAHVLRPRDGVDSDFLLHALAIRPDVGDMISGSTRGKLNQQVAASIPVPLPALQEQRRAAGYLNDAFADVAAVRNLFTSRLATIQNVPTALMTLAFNGEL